MWTPTARRRYSRTGLRYASDLTDAEWAPLIEPLLPAACRRGRPRSWPWRAIVDAILYVLRGGIAWRLPPTDFPPWQTASTAGSRPGATPACSRPSTTPSLVMADRARAGRGASPTAAIIDGQSVRTTEGGGPRGYDAGKRAKGRKRHALVDTDGRALLVRAHAADLQDRDGAVPLLRASRGLFPWIEAVFADAGYAADRVAAATRIAVEIVRKHPGQVGFAVHPRRWVVERFFAWLGRNRGLAKDVEATIASATAFLYAAPVMLLLRRVARAA